MGVTILNGEGFYTRSERRVIISVVNRRERLLVFRMIKSIDPFAFVTMGNVSGVWGEGFDIMKVKESKANAHIMVMLTDDKQDMDNNMDMAPMVVMVNKVMGKEDMVNQDIFLHLDKLDMDNKDIISQDMDQNLLISKYQ